jgi:hypothetical protein
MGQALIKGIGMALSDAGEDMSERLKQERIQKYRQGLIEDDRAYQDKRAAEQRSYQSEQVAGQRAFQAEQADKDRASRERMDAPQRGLIQMQLDQQRSMQSLLDSYDNETDPQKKAAIERRILIAQGRSGKGGEKPQAGRYKYNESTGKYYDSATGREVDLPVDNKPSLSEIAKPGTGEATQRQRAYDSSAAGKLAKEKAQDKQDRDVLEGLTKETEENRSALQEAEAVVSGAKNLPRMASTGFGLGSQVLGLKPLLDRLNRVTLSGTASKEEKAEAEKLYRLLNERLPVGRFN